MRNYSQITKLNQGDVQSPLWAYNMSVMPKPENEPIEQAPYEFSFLIVKPNAVKTGLTGVIRQELVEAGMDIICESTIRLDRRAAEIFYCKVGDQKDEAISHVTSGDSYIFMVFGTDIVRRLLEIRGRTAWKERISTGLRKKYAFDHIQNSVHCPDSYEEAVDGLNLVFPQIRDMLLKTQLSDELVSFLLEDLQLKRCN